MHRPADDLANVEALIEDLHGIFELHRVRMHRNIAAKLLKSPPPQSREYFSHFLGSGAGRG
jgi:hypothetical protein